MGLLLVAVLIVSQSLNRQWDSIQRVSLGELGETDTAFSQESGRSFPEVITCHSMDQTRTDRGPGMRLL